MSNNTKIEEKIQSEALSLNEVSESENEDLIKPNHDANIIEELQSEITKLKDRVLRSAAEVENTRKRAQKDIADSAKYSITKFARDLIEVSDNIGRALDAFSKQSSPSNLDMKSLIDGIKMTDKSLCKAFGDNHIQKIYPLGEKFDPNKHQAVCEISDTNHPCGHIIQVIQSGYMIHDRLLRPAMVGVVKNIKNTHIQENTSDTIQSKNVSE
jgi:molecular chaperone GrpE